jgi:PiT family inorganic phosphate transporter
MRRRVSWIEGTMNFVAALTDLSNQAMSKPVEPTDSVSTGAWILLCLAVAMALAFEFVNGFHDTANAVATVIYTHSLKPWVAVVWSGLCNLAGVLLSPSGVAFTIVALLPAEMVIHVGTEAGFAMVFALLISAILWNLGTWYLGLPASSTHTLTGAIMGVGLCNSLMAGGHFGEGVNWDEVRKVFLTLLVSPIFGFVGAALLLLLSKLLLRWPALYAAPPKDTPPPMGVRALLITTCTGVSFFHGSNDGQKGMGLLLLILIGVLPSVYALKLDTSSDSIHKLQTDASVIANTYDPHPDTAMGTKAAEGELEKYLRGKDEFDSKTLPALGVINHDIAKSIAGHQALTELSTDARAALRSNLYLTGTAITKLKKEKRISDAAEQTTLDNYKTKSIDPLTQFIPTWVKIATACALGFGTMIGWKRIVVTVGEKIGKEHLTYAQGASAEIMAMATIFAADKAHLPVSTTHVLSSGVAGTMVANGSGLQMATLRNILLAWVLTLPVCVVLGAGLFAAALVIVLHNLAPAALGLLVVALLGFAIWKSKSTRSKPAETPATMTAA